MQLGTNQIRYFIKGTILNVWTVLDTCLSSVSLEASLTLSALGEGSSFQSIFCN